MALPVPFNFTTGPSALPDVEVLSYNGCVFSPLFVTNVHGKVVKDAANRTTKLMEYDIEADGYVTLPDGLPSISPIMVTLRTLLTAQAGELVYRGRGMDLVINPPGAVAASPGLTSTRDAVWGPAPELLEFQPLGGGNSAKVRWSVKVRIPETPPATVGGGGLGGRLPAPLLQFNYETNLSYDEAGYSSFTVKGTLEIATTRSKQTDRKVPITADDFRTIIDERLSGGIDLSRFRITKRSFPVSRDKRVMEWEFAAEEKPYMDLPPDITVARGTYSVRPKTAGMGLCNWLCTLRATYTVRADRPRRIAWFAFLALLRLRMIQSIFGNVPKPADGGVSPARGALTSVVLHTDAIVDSVSFGAASAINAWVGGLMTPASKPASSRKAFLLDFSFDEGLYLDSKTTSFSATWRLVTTFSHILIASGLWKKVDESDARGNNLWAASMRIGPGGPTGIMGAFGWLPNKLDSTLDVIVDFGGG